ncbi:MAG: ATP-binding protein [Actinomycetota bacterium]|nr:ATP-binding protein [Actinomycetota bacterium]
MHQHFVGRAREFGALLSSVDAAAAGQPAYVLVEGEGGCGKTSLLHAFKDLASQADVVIATGDEAEARLPYGVLSLFMRQLTTERSLVESPTDRGADPFVVGAAFLQMLGQESRSKPLVLMLDDALSRRGRHGGQLGFAPADSPSLNWSHRGAATKR